MEIQYDTEKRNESLLKRGLILRGLTKFLLAMLSQQSLIPAKIMGSLGLLLMVCSTVAMLPSFGHRAARFAALSV